jgi:hypothetical protein
MKEPTMPGEAASTQTNVLPMFAPSLESPRLAGQHLELRRRNTLGVERRQELLGEGGRDQRLTLDSQLALARWRMELRLRFGAAASGPRCVNLA